jgi:hypothetical protein
MCWLGPGQDGVQVVSEAQRGRVVSARTPTHPRLSLQFSTLEQYPLLHHPGVFKFRILSVFFKMAPVHAPNTLSSRSINTLVTLPCPLFIEQLVDPAIGHVVRNAQICVPENLHGYRYLAIFVLNYLLAILVLRQLFVFMSYFRWWRAVLGEIEAIDAELDITDAERGLLSAELCERGRKKVCLLLAILEIGQRVLTNRSIQKHPVQIGQEDDRRVER